MEMETDTMTTAKPKLNIGNDEQEDFIPEAAEYFAYGDNYESSQFVGDTGIREITGIDADGNTVVLWYFPSNVVVHHGEYDVPDSEVEVTTAPATVEYISTDVWNADECNPIPILNSEPVTLPDDVVDLWNRADHTEVSEDYICATGIDDSPPVGQQFEIYFILGVAFIEGELDTPFYTHEAVDTVGYPNEGTKEERAAELWKLHSEF